MTDLDDQNEELPHSFREHRSRIMYIESKSEGLDTAGRIGRVYFSKTGKTLYYKNKKFSSLGGRGFKSNYVEVSSGDEYWISGARRDQNRT